MFCNRVFIVLQPDMNQHQIKEETLGQQLTGSELFKNYVVDMFNSIKNGTDFDGTASYPFTVGVPANIPSKNRRLRTHNFNGNNPYTINKNITQVSDDKNKTLPNHNREVSNF